MSFSSGGGIVGWFVRWASGLRFPWLFAITATIFLADLLVPDVIPFADEILLGLFVGLLAALRKRRTESRQAVVRVSASPAGQLTDTSDPANRQQKRG